jgi:hypothetical protein
VTRESDSARTTERHWIHIGCDRTSALPAASAASSLLAEAKDECAWWQLRFKVGYTSDVPARAAHDVTHNPDCVMDEAKTFDLGEVTRRQAGRIERAVHKHLEEVEDASNKRLYQRQGTSEWFYPLESSDSAAELLKIHDHAQEAVTVAMKE